MMLPARWTGREMGASLSNDRCVLISLGHLEKLLSMRIACGSGVNVHESERERSGIICRQFCGVG